MWRALRPGGLVGVVRITREVWTKAKLTSGGPLRVMAQFSKHRMHLKAVSLT